jgi:hypothetical protein
MLELFRCTSVPSFMVIGNSLLRGKHENANYAWIALWSLTKSIPLKATTHRCSILVGISGSSELEWIT